MFSPIIKFENVTDSVMHEVKAVGWKVYRRYVRFRYDYVNGGTGFNYRSYKTVFEFSWPHLSAESYDKLLDIVNSVASGDTVKITTIGTKEYNLDIELDSDDFIESQGEFAETGRFEIAFIAKNAQQI